MRLVNVESCTGTRWTIGTGIPVLVLVLVLVYSYSSFIAVPIRITILAFRAFHGPYFIADCRALGTGSPPFDDRGTANWSPRCAPSHSRKKEEEEKKKRNLKNRRSQLEAAGDEWRSPPNSTARRPRGPEKSRASSSTWLFARATRISPPFPVDGRSFFVVAPLQQPRRANGRKAARR